MASRLSFKPFQQPPLPLQARVSAQTRKLKVSRGGWENRPDVAPFPSHKRIEGDRQVTPFGCVLLRLTILAITILMPQETNSNSDHPVRPASRSATQQISAQKKRGRGREKDRHISQALSTFSLTHLCRVWTPPNRVKV